MKQVSEKILERLIDNAPELKSSLGDIKEAISILIACYENGNKVMICGNGGSAADAEHIVGELMKGFILKRPISNEHKKMLQKHFPQDAVYLASRLQAALPALSLVSQTSLSSAYANDVEPGMVFAQQVYGYAKKGDVLIGLSTSGSSKNILAAVKVAKSFNVRTVCFTGKSGGALKSISDVCIRVPSEETYRIQEYHLMTYHAICAIIEAEFFRE